MDLNGRTVALYGRFSPGARERLSHEIARRGGHVLRDLTRRSDLLVVGALATSLIESGALAARLKTAAERGAPVFGERGFDAALKGAAPRAATLPLRNALAGTSLTADDVQLLAAFDLIEIGDDACRFADAAVIRAADDLQRQAVRRSELVRILARVRDLAPRGRHKLVLSPSGEAALEWADGGLTSLGGQGYLALSDDHPSLEDLFEAAAVAEASGEADVAARLYDQCARADRGDAIAPYNLGNLHLAERRYDQAAIAYQQALARDPGLVEARYNLAQALEGAGKPAAAATELERLLHDDPAYADALFNLAQLRMGAHDLAAAKTLYERYLALSPPDDWAAMARKALRVCEAGPTK
jgi:tetratricopeptide (TPR) repeat protein